MFPYFVLIVAQCWQINYLRSGPFPSLNGPWFLALVFSPSCTDLQMGKNERQPFFLVPVEVLSGETRVKASLTVRSTWVLGQLGYVADAGGAGETTHPPSPAPPPPPTDAADASLRRLSCFAAASEQAVQCGFGLCKWPLLLGLSPFLNSAGLSSLSLARSKFCECWV